MYSGQILETLLRLNVSLIIQSWHLRIGVHRPIWNRYHLMPHHIWEQQLGHLVWVHGGTFVVFVVTLPPIPVHDAVRVFAVLVAKLCTMTLAVKSFWRRMSSSPLLADNIILMFPFSGDLKVWLGRSSIATGPFSSEHGHQLCLSIEVMKVCGPYAVSLLN
jgi:hypothetical protein